MSRHSAKVQELRGKIETKSAEAQTLLDKADPTADDLAAASAIIDTDIPAMKSELQTFLNADAAAAKLDGVKSWLNEPAAMLPQQGAAAVVGSGVKAGTTEINLLTGEIVKEEGAGVLSAPQVKAVADPLYLNAFKSYLRSKRGLEGVKSGDEIKMLSEGIDTEGGFLVPAEMIARMIAREPAPTKIVDLVQTITVSSDRAQMLKTNYDADDLYASAVRVYKTAEGAAAGKANQPLFGTLTINVHSFTAELSISNELLEDAAFDVIGYLSEQFRIAYRNFCADKVLNGSGVGEHFGILTRAGTANGPATINSGDANNLTFDGLQKMKFAVPEQYDQNARYVFNKRSSGLAIASMKDADNRPLWPVQQQAGMVGDVPGNLFGYSYAYEAFMPDVAANKTPVIFGDLKGYIRAMRLGMSIQVLREVEARRGQVVLLARFREGGDVAEPWRLKVQKIAA